MASGGRATATTSRRTSQGLFLTNYDGLATSLLSAILDVGGEALMDEIFLARRRQAKTRTRDQLRARVAPDAPLAPRAGDRCCSYVVTPGEA